MCILVSESLLELGAMCGADEVVDADVTWKGPSKEGGKT